MPLVVPSSSSYSCCCCCRCRCRCCGCGCRGRGCGRCPRHRCGRGRGRGCCSCRLNDFSRAIISISIQGLGLMCLREAAVCRGSALGSLSPNKDCSMSGIPTRATVNISLIMRPLTVDTGVPSVVLYSP